MTQEIIVYGLIIFAIANSLYYFFAIFANKKNSACGGCQDCEIKRITQKNY